jgi:hypothetical protein
MANDPTHFEAPDWRQTAQNQPASTPWSQVASNNVEARGGMPVSASMPDNALPGGGTTLDSPFHSFLRNTESGNQNIFSKVDKDYAGQAGSRSQGFYQIDTPTWNQFAPKAGVDVTKFPSAMNADLATQTQVVNQIPFSRFGQRTQDMVMAKFGKLDPSMTVGQLAQSVPSVPGTTLNSGPDSATPAPAGSPSPASLLGQGNVSGALGAMAGNPDVMKGIGDLGKALGGPSQGQQMPAPPPPPHVQTNQSQIAQMAPQMMAQIMAQQQAQQRRVPGMSLNGMGGFFG